MARRFTLALLSDTPVEDDVVLDGDVVAEVTDSLDVADDAGEVTEVEQQAADIDAGSDVIDDAIDDAETVEAIAEKSEEADAEGGLSAVAVEALNIAVRRIMAPHGIKGRALAIENFASKAKRPAATKVAVEDWKQQAKELWDKVMAAIRGAIEKVKLFFKALFDRSEKLRQQGEKLKQIASGKGAVKADAGPIDLGSSGQYLCEGGKFAGGAALVSAFEKHAKTVEDTIEKQVREVIMKAADSAKALFGAVQDTTMFDERLTKFVFPKGSDSSKKVEGLPEGLGVTELASLLGDRQVYAVTPTAGVTAAQLKDSMGAIRVFVDTAEGYKAPEKTEGAAASAEDVAKLGAAIAEHYAKYKDISKKLDVMAEAVKKALEVKPKAEAEGSKANITVAIKAAKALGNLATSTQREIYGYDVSVGSAVYSYAVKSLKGAEAKPTEDDKAAK